MAARLGTVLFIFGCIVAGLFGLITVALSMVERPVPIAILAAAVIALFAFLVGAACRYVLTPPQR